MTGIEIETTDEGETLIGDFEEALRVAALVGDLGLVERLTRHPDGTNESDTTHSMMLGMVAWQLATLDPDLNPCFCLAFAMVHDMPEALVGDTPTLGGLTAEQHAAKEALEAQAIEQIEETVSFGLAQWIKRYESKIDREARFVWVLDKAMPKVVRAWRGRLDLPESVDMTVADLVAAHKAQRANLALKAPDVPIALAFYDLVCERCEAVWGGSDGHDR